MSFFNQFPTRSYRIKGTSVLTNITDIYRYVDVNDLQIDKNVSYLWHNISEGDRPDIISRKLYGDPRYYWTFFIINDHLKDGVLDAWPKSSEELERYLEDQYDKYAVIEMIPSTTIPYTTLNSTVNGIDISYENLRIVTTTAENSTKWKIAEYDSDRFQIWIIKNTKEASSDFNAFKSILDSGFKIQLVNDETPGTVKYAEVKEKNKVWSSIATNEIIKDVTFRISSKNTWYIGREAPYNSTDNISWAIHEIKLNDSKRNIRVLPLNSIRDFSESYREILNNE
jgi:hypothetical protein